MCSRSGLTSSASHTSRTAERGRASYRCRPAGENPTRLLFAPVNAHPTLAPMRIPCGGDGCDEGGSKEQGRRSDRKFNGNRKVRAGYHRKDNGVSSITHSSWTIAWRSIGATGASHGCLQGSLRRFRFRSKWDTCRDRDRRSRRRGGRRIGIREIRAGGRPRLMGAPERREEVVLATSRRDGEQGRRHRIGRHRTEVSTRQ